MPRPSHDLQGIARILRVAVRVVEVAGELARCWRRQWEGPVRCKSPCQLKSQSSIWISGWTGSVRLVESSVDLPAEQVHVRADLDGVRIEEEGIWKFAPYFLVFDSPGGILKLVLTSGRYAGGVRLGFSKVQTDSGLGRVRDGLGIVMDLHHNLAVSW